MYPITRAIIAQREEIMRLRRENDRLRATLLGITYMHEQAHAETHATTVEMLHAANDHRMCEHI